MTSAEPSCIAATYSFFGPADGHRNGLGPSGLGCDPMPLPFSTSSLASRSARTAVGYQPFGTNPSTFVAEVVTSVTAIAFASEQATYIRCLSGLRARELGVIPTGCRGVSA